MTSGPEQQRTPAQSTQDNSGEIPESTHVKEPVESRGSLLWQHPSIRKSKQQGCRRYRSREHVFVTEEGKVATSHTYCYVLSCEDCWPLVVMRRALALKADISKELDQVWYGRVPYSTRSAISTFKGRTEGVKTTTSSYRNTDIMTVLASANVTPTQPYLQHLPVARAIELWFLTGIKYRLKKMYSDWDKDGKTNIDHIFTGDSKRVDELFEITRISKGDTVEDTTALSAQFYRFNAELNEGADDYP